MEFQITPDYYDIVIGRYVYWFQSLEWRKKNNIDTILQETLEVENYFPFMITRDREGRPGI